MNDFDWTNWTDWHPLESVDLSMIGTGPGAYVIATNRPLSRAVGVDEEGFLDVGESKYLRQRVRDFRRCALNRGEEGHMAGWRYSYFRFDKHYPPDTLRVRWVAASSKDDAYLHEGKVLLVYLRRHAELPPLNYKFNWKVFKELGWGIVD